MEKKAKAMKGIGAIKTLHRCFLGILFSQYINLLYGLIYYGDILMINQTIKVYVKKTIQYKAALAIIAAI